MTDKSNSNSVSAPPDCSLEQQIDDFIKSADGLKSSENTIQLAPSSIRKNDSCSPPSMPKRTFLTGRPSTSSARPQPSIEKDFENILQAATPTLSVSDDSDSEEIVQRGAYADAKTRVGREYQAMPPQFIAKSGSRCNSPDHALCIWSPITDSGVPFPESELASFINQAKEKFGYTPEQALGMLYWHKHNIELATADLPNFVPYPDEWTHEEKIVFEQAFSFQGKQFNKIIHALPDKSVQHLVKYYYLWKKTRAKSSMLERRGERADSESECSDGELPEMRPGCRRIRRPKRKAPRLDSEHQHQRKRRVPRGIFLDYEAFLSMAGRGESESAGRELDSQLGNARVKVQQNRGELTKRWESLLTDIQAYQEPDSEGQISYKWTDEELLLAVQGVRRYGKDFRAIAQLIGSKTENHVRYFYAQYRSKFGLDSVLAEFNKENSGAQQEQQANR